MKGSDIYDIIYNFATHIRNIGGNSHSCSGNTWSWRYSHIWGCDCMHGIYSTYYAQNIQKKKVKSLSLSCT